MVNAREAAVRRIEQALRDASDLLGKIYGSRHATDPVALVLLADFIVSETRVEEILQKGRRRSLRVPETK